MSFGTGVSNMWPAGKIRRAKAFSVAPEGVLNKLKPRDIFSPLLAFKRLVSQYFSIV